MLTCAPVRIRSYKKTYKSENKAAQSESQGGQLGAADPLGLPVSAPYPILSSLPHVAFCTYHANCNFKGLPTLPSRKKY